MRQLIKGEAIIIQFLDIGLFGEFVKLMRKKYEKKIMLFIFVKEQQKEMLMDL